MTHTKLPWVITKIEGDDTSYKITRVDGSPLAYNSMYHKINLNYLNKAVNGYKDLEKTIKKKSSQNEK